MQFRPNKNRKETLPPLLTTKLLRVESETDRLVQNDVCVFHYIEQCCTYIYRVHVDSYKCEREEGVKRHLLGLFPN